MKKRWEVKNSNDLVLPEAPELPLIIRKVLAMRGYFDNAEIDAYLNPDYEKLHDPFLFKEMQNAVERIKKAIDEKEKIFIYADYDADAITACSVVYLAFKKLGITVDYYIPDRFTEGYGVNDEAIRKIAEAGGKLIITVDCGINAVKEIELANSLDVDIIITDHHELTDNLPPAAAVINPKNPFDQYPFPYLTGVGVAFKLVQGLFFYLKITEGWEKWLLDLVAIGTVADCQSLTGENRVLVSFGLRVLGKTRWVGLREMMKQAGIGKRVDTFTLGFVLAPRINAAGRIKHASTAFELLVCENNSKAMELAKELNDLNTHRQNLTEQILSEAKSQIELIADKKILITHGVDWPKGIVGLVAGKLTEEYNRPVLAISSSSDGQAIGSARSIPSFDIVEALKYAKDLLLKYGGHTQAAGFTLSSDKLQDFHLKLLEYAETTNLVIEDPIIYLDGEMEPNDISWEIAEYIDKMAPFGIGNAKPKFFAAGLQVMDLRTLSGGKHLKLKLKFGDKTFDAIAFNQGFKSVELTIGKIVEVAFELSTNEWNGNKELQMKILDIKIKE